MYIHLTHLFLNFIFFSGIGSVLLSCKWLFPTAKSTGIEAQPTSFALAQRSIEYNTGSCCNVEAVDPLRLLAEHGTSSSTDPPVDDIVVDRLHVPPPVRLLAGDIRMTHDTLSQAGLSSFDLVTGTPPYFKLKVDENNGDVVPINGGMPSCVNSAPARNEFRGGIEEYCLSAAATILPRCPIIITMAHDLKRVEKAAKEAKLKMFRRLEVSGKVGKAPLFSCFCFVLQEEVGEGEREVVEEEEEPCVVEKINVRGLDNSRTDEYVALMERMGIPP